MNTFVIRASMGPHFFKCGKPGNHWRVPDDNMSFNGAALFQVRKVIPAAFPFFAKQSFNGAALFQVRKEISKPLWSAWRFRFNGAALFQVRKEVDLVDRLLELAIASMGPHFFKCGKQTGGRLLARQVDSASMGPHFFKCGK